MSMAIDTKNHKLHFFGGGGPFGHWLILNLKTRLWDLRKDLFKYKMPLRGPTKDAKCIVVRGSLHVMTKGHLLRYQRSKRRFVDLGKAEASHGLSSVGEVKHMFYVEALRRIYVFAEHSMIWMCEHNDTLSSYVWRRCEVMVPCHANNAYHAVQAFEHIVFIFFYQRDEVWCIDLERDCRERCEQKVHLEGATYASMVGTERNMAHLLSMDYHGARHSVLRLKDLLPASFT